MPASDPASQDLVTHRTGLPDALRILLETYPREAWDQDPNFHGLVSFRLSRHLMFREVLQELKRDMRAFSDGSDGPRDFAGLLSRTGGGFVAELHGHHGIEDMHYFPRLARMEPRLEAGFALLDGDHDALDGQLSDFVEAANALLSMTDTPKAMRGSAGRFAGQLERFETFLDRHLIDEEELVVPVILRHGEEVLG